MSEKQTDPENGVGMCSGPDCCPPAGKTGRWKVLISLLILGAAGAVMAYSITSKNAQESDTTRPGPSVVNPVTTTGTGKATQLGACGLTQDSIDHFTEMASESDAGFILVPGKIQAQTQEVTALLDTAVAQIESSGNDVMVFTAASHTDDALDGPCVVTIKNGSQAALVPGPITSEKLIQAFVSATRPPPSCSEDCDCNK